MSAARRPSRPRRTRRARRADSGRCCAACDRRRTCRAEHFLADPHILEIIGRGDPHAQDVGAALADDLERIDDIAEALRHLAALAVEREAVGQHRVIGRAAARAAAFEQRRLEPAAMLVRAFEIEVGADALAVARLDHEGVGRAAVEPDVEDVGDDLIIGERRSRGRAAPDDRRANHASAPPAVKASTMRALTAGSLRYSPVARLT